MCCAVLCVVVSGPHTNLYVRCGTNTLRTRRRTSLGENRYDIHTIDLSFWRMYLSAGISFSLKVPSD